MLLELQPGLEAELALQLEKQLRAEFVGERVYVKKPKPSPEEIVQRLNGQNVKQVARDLGVSRETVYSAIRRRRELRNK
ncbi:MAG: helix-turn-helix domain-containing protein [Sterolibacterium sp.]